MKIILQIDNKQKAMDAAPLNTSIIILCSEVGFTFGNEIVQMLSKICDVKRLNENSKWVVVGRNWNKNFLERIKRSSMCELCIQREKPLLKSLDKTVLMLIKLDKSLSIQIWASGKMLQFSVKALLESE